jgi:hypothetical protein
VAASCRHLACTGAADRVGMAGTSRRSRPGELHRRQVVLLAESAGLVAVLGHLLGPADRLSRVGSLRELARSRSLEGADVVVLDLPDEDRAAAVGSIRGRYRGRLVVLAGEGEGPGEPLPDDACTLLARPFSVEELAAALGVRDAALGVPGAVTAAAAAAAALPAAQRAGVTPATGTAPAHPAAPPAPAALAGRLDLLVDRGQRLLVALVEGWRDHRQVRVAGFAALALVAFTVAFAVAAQGRCGSGCDPLGTGISPAPTIASVQSSAPSGTHPGHPTSTTILRAGTPGAGAFLGTSRQRATTSSEQDAASTTSRRVVTTRPATTRPATSRSTVPPTTAPTTTGPVITPTTTGSETPAPEPAVPTPSA